MHHLGLHPQSNGVVERDGVIIFTGMKKNITEQPKGKWLDELVLTAIISHFDHQLLWNKMRFCTMFHTYFT